MFTVLEVGKMKQRPPEPSNATDFATLGLAIEPSGWQQLNSKLFHIVNGRLRSLLIGY